VLELEIVNGSELVLAIPADAIGAPIIMLGMGPLATCARVPKSPSCVGNYS
jgi:hypothetical protein